MTPKQIASLEQSFQNDCTNEEAAGRAKCTLLELYNYIAIHDEWYTTALLSAHAPLGQAKVNLGEAVMNGDTALSLTLLERKRPKEWSNRQQIDLSIHKPMVILPPMPPPIIDITATTDVIDTTPTPRDLRPAEMAQLAADTAESGPGVLAV